MLKVEARPACAHHAFIASVATAIALMFALPASAQNNQHNQSSRNGVQNPQAQQIQQTQGQGGTAENAGQHPLRTSLNQLQQAQLTFENARPGDSQTLNEGRQAALNALGSVETKFQQLGNIPQVGQNIQGIARSVNQARQAMNDPRLDPQQMSNALQLVSNEVLGTINTLTSPGQGQQYGQAQTYNQVQPQPLQQGMINGQPTRRAQWMQGFKPTQP
jgi:hypothetical protein